MKKCSVCGREHKRCVFNEKYGNVLCGEHNYQYNKYGKLFKWNIKSENEYVDCGDYYEIILLNKNKEEVGMALIDKEDYDKVINIKWYHTNGYCRNATLGCSLHGLVFGEHDGDYVDHISRNRLDCRKQNLRSVSGSLNGFNKGKQSNNTSGHVGVSWDKSHNMWESHIKINKKKKFLGYFKNIEDAVKCREEAELKYYGEIIDRSSDEYTVFKKKIK